MRDHRAVVLLLLASLAASPRAAGAQAQPGSRTAARDEPQPAQLLIGLIPEMNIFKQKARFKPLGEHLSKRLGMPVRFTILRRYGNVLETFRIEQMDGAFFGSFTGALAIERLGVVPLARPVNLDGSSTYRGRIFVREDGPFRSVEDLRGRRMAFVERATTAGYVFPLAWLRENGVRSGAAFFGESWFTGSHDAAIQAVLDGKADVAAAKHTVHERMRAEDPRVDRELRVLAESPAVPSNGLCVRPSLPRGLQQKLRDALLGLDRDPDGAAVLQELGALRFVPASAEDYRPVAELAAKAGIDLKSYEYVNQ